PMRCRTSNHCTFGRRTPSATALILTGRLHCGKPSVPTCGDDMEKKDEELIQSLLPHDSELKSYYEEHLTLERQLAEFNRKPYLTPEQELERKQLQKRKLHGKDRIMQILEKHRGAPRGASAH